MGYFAHAQTVDTRPLFGGEWPGDEATATHAITYTYHIAGKFDKDFNLAVWQILKKKRQIKFSPLIMRTTHAHVTVQVLEQRMTSHKKWGNLSTKSNCGAIPFIQKSPDILLSTLRRWRQERYTTWLFLESQAYANIYNIDYIVCRSFCIKKQWYS